MLLWWAGTEWLRLALCKGPNRVGVSPFTLASKSILFQNIVPYFFRIPNGGQSPKLSNSEYYTPLTVLQNLQPIFKFRPFPKRNFQVWIWTFYRSARNICVTRGSFPAYVKIYVNSVCNLLASRSAGCTAQPVTSGHISNKKPVISAALAQWFMKGSSTTFP
jgi:hypothetical protein